MIYLNSELELRFLIFKDFTGQNRFANMNSEKEAELKALFASYDQNGDGNISAEELKSAFQKLGASISDDEINNMVNSIDFECFLFQLPEFFLF